MVAIESDTFNIDSVMALLGGVDTNYVLAGTRNRWRVWHHEPPDTLVPASWILELGDHRYPLQQSTAWCPRSKTSALTSRSIEMALTVEACHRLDLKRLFKSGRVEAGSSGTGADRDGGSTVASWRCRAPAGAGADPAKKRAWSSVASLGRYGSAMHLPVHDAGRQGRDQGGAGTPVQVPDLVDEEAPGSPTAQGDREAGRQLGFPVGPRSPNLRSREAKANALEDVPTAPEEAHDDAAKAVGTR
jgi:hypothetical protein